MIDGTKNENGCDVTIRVRAIRCRSPRRVYWWEQQVPEKMSS